MLYSIRHASPVLIETLPGTANVFAAADEPLFRNTALDDRQEAVDAACREQGQGTSSFAKMQREAQRYSGDLPLRESMVVRSVEVHGSQRIYFLQVPDDLDPNVPAPAILAFHGGGGGARRFANMSGLGEPAGRAGFVVAYLQGYRNSWNAGNCCGRAWRQGVDDVAFARVVLNDLASVLQVDPRRVFATGFSNGAMMAYRLACELSERIAAIVAVSATISLPDSACTPGRPVPVLHIHGLADEFSPFRGGIGAWAAAGVLRSVPETMALWIARNRCTEETRVTYELGRARCVTHPVCQDAGQVTRCTIKKMGHQWPGARVLVPNRSGPRTLDISANEMLVEFFRRHQLPSHLSATVAQRSPKRGLERNQ